MAECCSYGNRLVYACSGEVDMEKIADQIIKKSPNEIQSGSSSSAGECPCGSC